MKKIFLFMLSFILFISVTLLPGNGIADKEEDIFKENILKKYEDIISPKNEDTSKKDALEKIRADLLKVLTTEERDWLRSHLLLITAGPKEFPPFNFYDKLGNHQGIASDYIKVFSKILDVHFSIRENLLWTEVLKKAENKELDFISCVATTSDREKYLIFSNPYLSFPMVIITRKDSAFLSGINDLNGVKVSCVNKTFINAWMERDGIKIIPYFVDTQIQALEAVSIGQADAHVANLATASYLIEKYGWFNLKIAAPTPYGNYDLYFAANTDMPELISIINKVLDLMPQQLHMAIRNKWLSIRYEHGFQLFDIIKWIIITSVFFGTLIIGGLIQYRKLQKVQKKLKLFKSIVDSSNEAIAVNNASGKFMYINPAHEKLFGRSIKESPSISYLDYYPVESMRIVNDIILPALKSGKTWEGTIDAIDANGRKFTLWERTDSIIDEKGNMICSFGLMHDVTKEKAMEKAIRESEERYRLLFNKAPLGIIHFDKNGVILECNQIFLDIIGSTRESIIGFNMLKSMPEGKARSAVDDALKYGEGHFEGSYHSVTIEKDIVIRAIYKRIDSKDGEVLGAIGIFEDITVKKKIETQLYQSQKLESIGTMAGGVAHDFNNILSIILGNAEMAIINVVEKKLFTKNLENIRKSCLRARDVIRQLLSFSKNNEEEKKTAQLSSIIKESISLIRASIPANIEIRENFQNKKDKILANQTQIHQVLINLCANAAHAMRENGGILEITLLNVNVDETSIMMSENNSKGEYIKMTVSDTGHGINPEIIDRIFDPYFTTKDLGEGSGLGLSVAIGIIKNHHGTISVHSDLNKGTTFEILFPLTRESNTDNITDDSFIPRGHESILFVDDEPFIVDITDVMLNELGYKVTATYDPVEALEIFKNDPSKFDLVITDMTMPSITGDKLAVSMMEIRPDIPIIILTGYSHMISSKKAQALGVKALVLKPLAIKELAITIRKVIAGLKIE
ncbi:MAG: transporter substrate-binding domain-containing protein [Desulfobacterales bacterium]|nr:transporter substrate-binding domain-containing protein [Desulfobacterales bacterium]